MAERSAPKWLSAARKRRRNRIKVLGESILFCHARYPYMSQTLWRGLYESAERSKRHHFAVYIPADYVVESCSKREFGRYTEAKMGRKGRGVYYYYAVRGIVLPLVGLSPFSSRSVCSGGGAVPPTETGRRLPDLRKGSVGLCPKLLTRIIATVVMCVKGFPGFPGVGY
jgi:hypothetical protein